MNDITATAIVSASAAIFGNLVASITTAWTARKLRNNELEKEVRRSELEILKIQNEKYRQQYERAHILLSIIQREFSLTVQTIDWANDLTTKQWDAKYIDLCKQSDELRMIASVFGAPVSTTVEEAYCQMNIYWGNFRMFLHRSEQGDKVDWQSPGYSDAHLAGKKVSGLADRAKDALQEKITQYTLARQ